MGEEDGGRAAAAKQHLLGPRWEGPSFFYFVVRLPSVTPAKRRWAHPTLPRLADGGGGGQDASVPSPLAEPALSRLSR